MSLVPVPSLVLSFEDARQVVEEHAAKLRPVGTEKLDLLPASGRVLAEPIHADRDFPPFPRAARDGYAVRASDLLHVPARLEVIAESSLLSPENIVAIVAENRELCRIIAASIKTARASND